MRYAVITDVHSNIFALKAALKEIDELKPDKIICLGDIVGNGAYPDETVQYIRRRGDILCVKGNHDMFATLDLAKLPPCDTRIKMFAWQQRVLTASAKAFLEALPDVLTFEDCGKKIVAFHYPKNQRNRFKDLIYLPTKEQVEWLFKGLEGDVFLFGHEHTGSLTEIGDRLFLNFGTLGNMLEKDCARYGILDVTPEKVTYKSITCNYDDTIPRKRMEEIYSLLGIEIK
ncbi:MAG: metallophosphoesterase family protein [Clostridia bacterium]|nr:metallophosphoesterase family protein [Clostridia bacterium]